MDEDELLTVDEVRARLKLKNSETVRRWLRQGKLRGVLIADSVGWRVKASDLDHFINSRMRGGEDPAPKAEAA